MAAKSAPTLLFFTSVRSGPARRMESLLATLMRNEQGRLKVVTALAEALGVTGVPTLVLVRGQRHLGRIEGHASGSRIEAMIRPHLADAACETAD